MAQERNVQSWKQLRKAIIECAYWFKLWWTSIINDHNLLEDLAYELKDVLHYQFISERHSTFSKKNRFYHLNFTAKTKGAGDFDSGMDNLFFAELMPMSGEYVEMVVSSFCMVKPSDNGHCYGCTNSGSVDMKHPDNVDAYAGGHLNVYLPHRRVGEYWNDTNDDLVAEEARLRRMYKGLGSL